MIAKNPASNLLEQSQYKYSLQDVEKPNLYREIYPYDEIPKVAFNHRRVPFNMPAEIWITDTTFRDGQQSRAPYTAKQIVDIYKMLSRLGGKNGNFSSTRKKTETPWKNAWRSAISFPRSPRGSARKKRILPLSTISASRKRAFSSAARTITSSKSSA